MENHKMVHIIMPVKESLLTAEQAIRAIVVSEATALHGWMHYVTNWAFKLCILASTPTIRRPITVGY